MFIFHAKHTKLIPLSPQRTFLRTLSSHVTVVTIFQPQISFHDLPTDVATEMHSECRMQYGYGVVI